MVAPSSKWVFSKISISHGPQSPRLSQEQSCPRRSYIHMESCKVKSNNPDFLWVPVMDWEGHVISRRPQGIGRKVIRVILSEGKSEHYLPWYHFLQKVSPDPERRKKCKNTTKALTQRAAETSPSEQEPDFSALGSTGCKKMAFLKRLNTVISFHSNLGS